MQYYSVVLIYFNDLDDGQTVTLLRYRVILQYSRSIIW